MIDVIDEENEIMPDILEEIFQLKQRQSSMKEEEAKAKEKEQKKKDDESFEIIDDAEEVKEKANEDEAAAKNEDNQEDGEGGEKKNFFTDDFEHISQYDPDDEFLRSSRSVSIIESILSKKSISQTSEFSVIPRRNEKKNGSIMSMGSSISSSI